MSQDIVIIVLGLHGSSKSSQIKLLTYEVERIDVLDLKCTKHDWSIKRKRVRRPKRPNCSVFTTKDRLLEEMIRPFLSSWG
jgi:hypothetical protein